MDELPVEILKQIRDGVDHLGSSLGERIDRLGDRVDHLETSLGERLDGTNHQLDRVARTSRSGRFHHKHVDLLEKDVDDLKARVSKLEKRRGS